MSNFLKQQNRELNKINIYRKRWVALSIAAIISTLFIIIDLNILKNQPILWIISIVGIIISVVWWYWTMKMIKLLLTHRTHEIEILSDIYKDIKDLRKDIRENLTE